MTQKLCCLVKSIGKCEECEIDVCAEHADDRYEERSEPGCRCGGCTETHTFYYCKPCGKENPDEDDDY